MTILETLQKRRSIRKYTQEHISDEKLNYILQAGLLVPSSRSIYPVELILVKEKEMLEKLSLSKKAGAAMLKDADACIVVIVNTEKSDVWVEDSAITMTTMMLAATECGVGNCWIQMRNREAENQPANDVVRELLGYPKTHEVLAILSLGMPDQTLPEHVLPQLDDVKIHREKY